MSLQEARAFLDGKEYLGTNDYASANTIGVILRQILMATRKDTRFHIDLKQTLLAVAVVAKNINTAQMLDASVQALNAIVSKGDEQMEEVREKVTERIETQMHEVAEEVRKEIREEIIDFRMWFDDKCRDLARGALSSATDVITEGHNPPGDLMHPDLNHPDTYAAAVAKHLARPLHDDVIVRGDTQANQIIMARAPETEQDPFSSLTEGDIIGKVASAVGSLGFEILIPPTPFQIVAAKCYEQKISLGLLFISFSFHIHFFFISYSFSILFILFPLYLSLFLSPISYFHIVSI